MPVRLDAVPADVRDVTVAALRQRRSKLVRDISTGLAAAPGFDGVNLADLAGILLTILKSTLKAGWVDARTPALQDLARYSPPLAVGQLIRAIHHAERTALGELSLDESVSATAHGWQKAAAALNAASIEMSAVVAESFGATHALRDPLTTLVSAAVFEFVLGQEIIRARRHGHGVAVILFDIDDLAGLNRTHGHGAGDWLLERLGILAGQYFRTHDLAARFGGDSIAVLLPETSYDLTSMLAKRFCSMVHQRLVLVEHKTEQPAAVTLSAAAVGTDLVKGDLDARTVMAEAEAAVVRAQMNGGRRLEQVALLPTAVTIAGAATLLGISTREVIRLLRRGDLRAAKRGRHFHIEREAIDEFRRRG